MRKVLATLFVVFISVPLWAHVGSPDVYFEGDAGPYHLFVTVRVPQVVPGVAEIQVRSAGSDVQSVQVVPLRLTGPGSNLPSIPDFAQRSKDDPQFFVSSLWLMEFGALQVRVQVDGAKGKAEISVPVPSVAQRSLPMDRTLRGLLAFFMLFLTLGIVLIAGAVVRESSMAPGETASPGRKRRAWLVMAATLVVALGILYLGRSWWTVEASSYARKIDLLKPPQADTELRNGNQLVVRPASQLKIPITGFGSSPDTVKMEDVIPDHGHLMHLFLVAVPGMDKMWHLHPNREDESFVEQLPAVPAGQYQVFADIVDKSGFPWTLVGNITLPQVNGGDPVGDDSTWAGAPIGDATSNTTAQLADGGRMVWERNPGPLKANAPASFKFRVEDKDGSPAHDLEPYMGMAAHAEIICSDLSVFAHIHPSGSVSMAALDMAQSGITGQLSAPGEAMMPMSMSMADSSHPLSPEVSFPYGFPHPGEYRVFVQVKRAGKVQTAAFDAQVD